MLKKMNKNNQPKYRAHAIALYSGGLDSILAILLMLRQNIKVTALYFVHYFGKVADPKNPDKSTPYNIAQKFGFKLEVVHLGQKFIDIVLEPQYGRGAHMNPCVDCKIMMLREAKTYMEEIGADFVITGEVIGQRPFSQLKNQMNLVLRKSGLNDKLLRPLCAKHLPPTEPELNGLVDREQLLDIKGRGRKQQIRLAGEFGLTDFPTPAGGCLLTDKGFSNRLKDLIEYHRNFTPNDIELLKIGRHFRIDNQTRIIVGRNEKENLILQKLAQPHHFLCDAPDIASPLSVLIGPASETNFNTVAGLTIRYSSARNKAAIKVVISLNGNLVRELTVAPASSFDYNLKAII
ncbi:MAG: tRNA 4-thiouridine(8) synthase ThiI [candidate division Zixibacteria bacterium]|nr:tRNA 4-thiouridine(8) synthase ThiI [candidate division Zixibacteria bacterium]MDD5425730.1 tRNA 4-thiouridine(8) synthase ThiI [candidate division Zixibacteria bacterium]